MAQPKQNNYNGLMLVQSEILQSLDIALRALNVFIDIPDDKAALTSCIDQLHQVNGTIDILNFDGAKLFSLEMLELAKALHEDNCNDSEQAKEILVHALLLLPHYLQLLNNDIQDHPLSLLETINQLRTARNEKALEANNLFKPKLVEPLPESIAPHPQQSVPNIGIEMNKLSHAFQLTLLHWLRNEDEHSLRKMRSILHFLRLNCQQERTTIFWWIAEGVIEALLEQGLQVSPEIKLNLGKLNQPIKIFAEDKEQQLVALFPAELERNLLLLVARSNSSGDYVSQLKDIFNLHFFDHRQKIYGMNNNALNDAHTAVLEQLQSIKENIGDSDFNTSFSNEMLVQTAEQLTTLVDTLQLLTEYPASHLLQNQVNELNAITTAGQLPDEQQLMALADSLLQVEALLNTTSNTLSPQQKQLQHAVINECLLELSNIKETLSTQAESADSDNTFLDETATQLTLIAGSLTMINLTDAAEMLTKTVSQIQRSMSNSDVLRPTELELFAEIIAGGDLYLEGIHQHGQPHNQFLDTANAKLDDFDRILADTITEENELESTPYDVEEVSAEPALEDSQATMPDLPVELETEITGVEAYLLAHANDEPLVLDSEPDSTPNEMSNLSVELETEQVLQFAEGIDPEIAEIFIEEAGEVSADLSNLIPLWREQQDQDSLATIRRHFHTLKGSGRMAGAQVIGELAWAVEDMLKQVLENKLTPSDTIEQIVADSLAVIPDLVLRFSQGEMETIDQVETLVSQARGIEAEEDSLQTIFNVEARQHIEILQQASKQLTKSQTVNNEMLRAIHSLKGCANIAQVTPIALIAVQLDQALQNLYKQNISLSPTQIALINEVADGLESILTSIKAGTTSEADIDLFANDIYLLASELTTSTSEQELIDPEYLAVFLEETDEQLDIYTKNLDKVRQDPENIEYRDSVHKILSSLSETAKQINLSAIAELYQLLDKLIVTPSSDSTTLFELLEQGYEELSSQIEHLMQNKTAAEPTVFKDSVDEFIRLALAEEPVTDELGVGKTKAESPEIISAEIGFNIPDIDADLLEAFTEECAELLESSDAVIKQWQQDPNNQDASLQLQRDLHTIKGGSRLTGIDPISDLTHHTESLVLAVCNNRLPADEQFFELLHRCQDRLAELQEQLAARSTLEFAHDLHAEITQIYKDVDVDVDVDVDEASHPEAEKETIDLSTKAELSSPDVEKTVDVKPPAVPTPTPAHVDQIRVRADLLDYLTNFAGEVSISRDRVSQQNTAMHHQLKEMNDTVLRLQEQLRKFEIETETQILFRYEDLMPEQHSECDPLELDRFSMMQQLSRGLAESVSDLHDISQSMDLLVHDSDSILLQQSRLNSDLQQGLMDTRLLPFSGITPRLERIVRQTNAELNKKSTLIVHGDDQELDRTIIDRIVAPIEHILRNAIAHGLEAPEERQKLGKDDTGALTLTLAREGSEILITLSDDGQGINVEKVKQKALELQLIRSDKIPSDDELIQFILNSGFSTADKVTQVSGRGVGMDVVNSEIRALKGRLNIQSEKGKGTTFNIRLPLTLSVLQALLVSTGDQQYAIPLANVYSGERITVADIKTTLASPTPQYEFTGEKFDFMPLCNLLEQPFNLPTDLKQQLPVLLFHTGKLRIALLVDAINSNREIVIKAVGEQLGQISSITGATILGDGQVVFILDIPTLVELNANEAHRNPDDAQDLALELAELQARIPVAMIVDDSITMRKASGNLLKRHGFNITTARDGVEALALLHEQKPDLILLDVEMPRMDGFEFASIVRNDEEFKHLPIIMITSRTGDKHRNRAMGIGVNVYMGKPYQEPKLVAVMKELLGDNYPQSKP